MTYKICKILINKKAYITIEEIQAKLDVFFAVSRLSDEQYLELTNLLKPATVEDKVVEETVQA